MTKLCDIKQNNNKKLKVSVLSIVESGKTSPEVVTFKLLSIKQEGS